MFDWCLGLVFIGLVFIGFLFVYVGVGFAFWVCCLLMLICTKVTKACGFLAIVCVSFYTGLKGHQGSLLSKTSESK